MLRVKIFSDGMPTDDYKRACNAYAAAVRTWATRRTLEGLQDTWGWAKEKLPGKKSAEYACGLVRVCSNHVRHYLQVSGQAGYFVEPVSFKDPIFGREKMRYKVEWYDQRDDENMVDYLNRALGTNPVFGITHGKVHLGFRVPDDEMGATKMFKVIEIPHTHRRSTRT